MGVKEKIMKIGNYNTEESAKVFIIAEIGMNHNGSLENAIKLIDQAVEIGADAVKFQMRDLKSLYTSSVIDGDNGDLGTEYTLNLLKKFELNEEQFSQIAEYSKSKNIIFLCTAWDKNSADKVNNLGVPVFKTASADFTNIDLLAHLISKNKPIILSTGMSTEAEIKQTTEFLDVNNAEYALLHCNSTYPAPFKDINLMYIDNLKKYGVPVGYSGHERGIAVTLAAVALGAKIIERHFTLDRSMEGPDHTASLEYDEFRKLINGIREIEISLGTNSERVITQGELINRENLSKSIYAVKNIDKDQVFKKNMFEIKSPGQGLSPLHVKTLIGKTSLKNINKGSPIFESDYIQSIEAKKNYTFDRPWAIPVRYHDINAMLKATNPDLIEFHMSYNDLNINPEKNLKGQYKCGFLVHAPELFENDHLLDLCSHDKGYKRDSIAYLQKVIDVTLKLKKYFTMDDCPKIIVNCGGFSKDGFLPVEERSGLYDNLLDSLSYLNTDGIEIIPQNMAPYPWHFGGQRYQNLFMDPDEILNFCNNNNIRVCHDISHSCLACNKFNWNHIEYIKLLAPVTAHFHIADGKGVDGEGLQIGEGTIDFKSALNTIKDNAPNVSFIPEVWQGHKNNGEGFWYSLEKLEGKI